jgi:hypothetical protein
VLTEVLLAIGLTIGLAALLATASVQYGSARREADARRLLRLAAAAELDRVRAGLVRVDPSSGAARPPTARPDGTTITISAAPADGAWRGLTLVRVTARKEVSNNRTIEVVVAAYLATPETSP